MFTDVVLPQRTSLCNLTLGELECLSGQCYLASKKCDGIYDCIDHTDEAACNYIIFNK